MFSLYQNIFKMGCHFYVCVCGNECHASPGVHGGQRRLLSPLEIQEVASCLVCELGSHSSPPQETAPSAAPTVPNLRKHQSLRNVRTLAICIRSHCRYIMSL